MNKSTLRLLLATLGFLLSAETSRAQDFNLFEQVETAPGSQSVQQRPGRESRVTSAKPDFTLVGTSQIGDQYSVILEDRDGKKIAVNTTPGVNTRIPENGDFQIIAVENGKVSISLPDSATCTEFTDSGVHCDSSANIAELTFPTTTPVNTKVQSSGIAAVPVQEPDQGTGNIEENPQNPFAIMRARAQNQGDNVNPATATDTANGGRFTPRRIDPAEVPPGMRVVSTPFGDRLVQQ